MKFDPYVDYRADCWTCDNTGDRSEHIACMWSCWGQWNEYSWLGEYISMVWCYAVLKGRTTEGSTLWDIWVRVRWLSITCRVLCVCVCVCVMWGGERKLGRSVGGTTLTNSWLKLWQWTTGSGWTSSEGNCMYSSCYGDARPTQLELGAQMPPLLVPIATN